MRGNGKLIAEDIAGSLSYYFFNAHGDVINRVNGSNGAVLKTYNYDSFGNIINPATVGDPNDPLYVDQSPFGYAGEYLDKENGEIYLRARYYSSANGRFVTEDPAKYGTNWYSYCENNPVTQIDRMGLSPSTDGSLNADKYANDYMQETYGDQYESVIESLPPIPESPKPETPKPKTPKSSKSSSGKKSSPSSTPSYIKHYNPDYNEFEP
ncbi:MAG: RHS repeat-associated core domain-containing protein, partial [Oscillospiraceae bacterium]|nr:RHS repeat-associated core domain-containing protein [Oscillospiraceae bacterium]